jgi:hypothetical protein
MNLIHINDARKILTSGQPVSLKFWKSDGSIVYAPNVICTSSFHHGNTVNIKFIDSKQVRKIRTVTIFEINDLELFL